MSEPSGKRSEVLRQATMNQLIELAWHYDQVVTDLSQEHDDILWVARKNVEEIDRKIVKKQLLREEVEKELLARGIENPYSDTFQMILKMKEN